MTGIEQKLVVLGLGQVGMRLAVALGAMYRTIGLDTDVDRICALSLRMDPLGVVDESELLSSQLLSFSADMKLLAEADYIFVAVPTAVDREGRLNLTALEASCRQIGEALKSGAVVVFESTVYPGATEKFCVPIIEKYSQKKWKRDFFVAYSPERINPGDSDHSLRTIKKVVAADCVETLDQVAAIYASIVAAGVHRVSSLKVAETTKLIENAQRDLNVALMNELSVICHQGGIDTNEVLQAAGTKWNFLPFKPGLVGGPCLGMAAHLLAQADSDSPSSSRLVLVGREVNESMVDFVCQQLVTQLRLLGIPLAGARILVLGLAFKANFPSTQNSKVLDLILAIEKLGCSVFAHDPIVGDAPQGPLSSTVSIVSGDKLPAECDAVILAVAHACFTSRSASTWLKLLQVRGLMMDLTATVEPKLVHNSGRALWRL